MKHVLLAVSDKSLHQEIRDGGRCQVVKIVPYLDSLPQIVEEVRPQTLVLSPYLPGKEDPRDIIHELTLLDLDLQIVLLAGNLEKKDELIQFALASGVRDIVFNPPASFDGDVAAFMAAEIADRIERPRSRRDVLTELGMLQRKDVPVVLPDALPDLPQAPPPVAEAQRSSAAASSVPFAPPVKAHRPYVVGVISPASAGATFVAQNVAAAMAQLDFETAVLDFDGKRTLHYWFGRDIANRSFVDLMEQGVLQGESTSVRGLHAFTSMHEPEREMRGDVGWMDTVREMPYDVTVLDFSSGRGWRTDLLAGALERCDEVLFVVDMDYARSQQSRGVLDRVSQLSVPVRFVLNKWLPEHQPCELMELVPMPPTYKVPFLPEVYQSIVYGKPLAELMPDLGSLFVLKELQHA